MKPKKILITLLSLVLLLSFPSGSFASEEKINKYDLYYQLDFSKEEIKETWLVLRQIQKLRA
jgi:hypothetical protein